MIGPMGRTGETNGGMVHVDAYDQQRRGQTVDVREYDRRWPRSGGGDGNFQRANASGDAPQMPKPPRPLSAKRVNPQPGRRRADLQAGAGERLLQSVATRPSRSPGLAALAVVQKGAQKTRGA